MWFAISLLTVICIASVIGTVLKQHEPAVNYVNQFGPFWAELFGALQLNAVYSAWWFLLILAFLVVSTSLCIARNTPKFLSDIKSYKENVREQSLRAFHHKAEAALAEGTEAEARRIGGRLASGGWKARLQQRDTAAGPGRWMVAAKAGAANKIRLHRRAQRHRAGVCGWFARRRFDRARPDVAGRQDPLRGQRADCRCEARAPLVRAQPDLPWQPGGGRRHAVGHGDPEPVGRRAAAGAAVCGGTQEVHRGAYSTGMPKLFASEIIIHDKATGERHRPAWR